MTNHRASYLKTTLLAAFATGGLLVLGAAASWFSSGLAAVIWTVTLVLAVVPLCVSLGGLLVLHRDARFASGRPDLFLYLNRHRSEASLATNADPTGLTWRRIVRALTGRKLLVGEWVAIRSFAEIRATLDANGCLDGLPFQPEMLRFCGTRARVFRCVDKIYDYGGKKNVRRLKDAVLLQGLRCDGAAHDGCQAACQLIWKEAWLQRDGLQRDGLRRDESVGEKSAETKFEFPPQKFADGSGGERYSCQFTQLVASSTELPPRDLRQDFRPILTGNLTVPAAIVAVLTRIFNRAQSLRGGIGYPFVPLAQQSSTPVINSDLQAGTTITVRSRQEIGSTLDKNSKNRGLWFDVDMVKHCGQSYRVLRRVDRIIDDANGKMRQMKTPCIVLQGVAYSGEGLRFCFQEDPTFWREIWLNSNAQIGSSPGAQTSAGADPGKAVSS